MLDQRGYLLRAALGFLALEPREPELHLLHRGPHLSPRPPLHFLSMATASAECTWVLWSLGEIHPVVKKK
jgi:hypothetical protein